MKQNHFQYFKSNISGIEIPKKFTFPFYYQAHSLAKIAANELQDYLENQTDFTHNFGLNINDTKNAIGKMFGVLVVKNKQNELGFLAAFSGKLEDESCPEIFVPPVFDLRTKNSFYRKGEEKIEKISIQLEALRNDENYLQLKKEVKKLSKAIEDDLALQRKKLKQNKTKRKALKKENINADDFINLEKKLTQESYNDQFFYKELVAYYKQKIDEKRTKLAKIEEEISTLKKLRKTTSAFLQQTLFEKFQFLNQYKKPKALIEIFNNPAVKPPAGSGECAAPKLLQYAFQNDLTPICMAEFWWGISPNSAIRKHKNFYPACQSRCKPILEHMLKGIEIDENLLIKEISKDKELEIIFEDDVLIVVNKPAEFLSVPGKEISDSVYSRIKQKYPKATGPLIVHRLDMSTSGILLLTKTKEANKVLQSQFINRTVKKRYVALLDGNLPKNKGKIQLPLRVDLDDRPKQLVCYEHGKNAETVWEVIERKDNKTRVYFYPITGRTHQLRVHAAHKNGLNSPIIGDDLYGKKQNRLHLHAEFIEFLHPNTTEKMSFRVAPDF
ncbi:RluA family pseudouridine synthase [Polaribacter aestuariivivens]|uniref:RluA family pseudouridine synthase n=1 Tax=Polaribacter aestuariivivens TaxID=2304626 RepID=A0A5S3N506_9FLAO|nr:RluA family pseudouridine synthase [Polaribacter aestuariivivens]TMM29972.1 RluA family pseudouridine synthase [Polaribacter aestuariivivens]